MLKSRLVRSTIDKVQRQLGSPFHERTDFPGLSAASVSVTLLPLFRLKAEMNRFLNYRRHLVSVSVISILILVCCSILFQVLLENRAYSGIVIPLLISIVLLPTECYTNKPEAQHNILNVPRAHGCYARPGCSGVILRGQQGDRD
jgi:hypothetical protein